MEYTVKTLADLSGVTPRTLRWYDRQGLLKPSRTTDAGYRIYGPDEVNRLQSILFYRELGFSLSDIREILDDPDYDRLSALQSHLTALEAQRTHLDALILTVRKTISDAKGDSQMSDHEKFEAFKQQAVKSNEDRYGKEIRAAYGDEEIDRANARVLSLTEAEYQDWKALENEIRSELEKAVQAGAEPEGQVGAKIANLHLRWLSYSWASYSAEAHRGLTELYVQDPRFLAYYDGSVPGCAMFLREAIRNHIH